MYARRELELRCKGRWGWRKTRLTGESNRSALLPTVVRWVGAAISVLLLVACVLGLLEYERELERRDPSARVMLGLDFWTFGLAVVFGCWLILHVIPLRARMRTATVLAALIAVSWIAGLALNGGGH